MENMPSSQTIESQPTQPIEKNTKTRPKLDITWKHCTKFKDVHGRNGLRCIHCGHESFGGGTFRMKEHLAGVKGNAKTCTKISSDDRFQIQGSMIEYQKYKKEKLKPSDMFDDCDDENASGSKQKRRKGDIASYMKAGKGVDKSQPSIQATMLSKERCHETNMAIALWFYDVCIPINAVNSIYFEPAISRIAKMGHGYKPPTYHALRVTLLNDAKKQVEMTINDFRSQWIETGCTIMGDGWTDQRGRHLINFLVYSPHGISFIKSVDASDYVSNAVNLCNMFSEIIEIVGVNNVVHVVTDNASNYKAAGKLLCHKYQTLFWSPCSAHCINLIMKDISELENVKDVITRASRITVFIYNHKWSHAWLRRREGWTEIIRPGATRFGTSFIALKSLYEHKDHLEFMVIDPEFKQFLKTTKGKEVREIVMDSNFWNKCLAIVNVMAPMMRLLRICDADEKPSLGYVYEGMARVINGIKETFKNDEKYYEPYVSIVEKRWDKMLRKRLHAAAFWLNPMFQFDSNSPARGPEAMKGLLFVLQKLAPNVDNIMTEISMFRDKKKTFGMQMALKSAKDNRPDKWWSIFGGDAPNLQKIAVKILSQTSSSSGCERNWSKMNENSYDPVDYENIDKVESWIVNEDPIGELDFDELEAALEQEAINNTSSQASKGNEGGDDMDMINENIDLSTLDKICSTSKDQEFVHLNESDED